MRYTPAFLLAAAGTVVAQVPSDLLTALPTAGLPPDAAAQVTYLAGLIYDFASKPVAQSVVASIGTDPGAASLTSELAGLTTGGALDPALFTQSPFLSFVSVLTEVPAIVSLVSDYQVTHPPPTITVADTAPTASPSIASINSKGGADGRLAVGGGLAAAILGLAAFL